MALPPGAALSVCFASGRALRGEPLRPLRGQLPFQGSHFFVVGYDIRCNKTMPPLKGEGDRR